MARSVLERDHERVAVEARVHRDRAAQEHVVAFPRGVRAEERVAPMRRARGDRAARRLHRRHVAARAGRRGVGVLRELVAGVAGDDALRVAGLAMAREAERLAVGEVRGRGTRSVRRRRVGAQIVRPSHHAIVGEDERRVPGAFTHLGDAVTAPARHPERGERRVGLRVRERVVAAPALPCDLRALALDTQRAQRRVDRIARLMRLRVHRALPLLDHRGVAGRAGARVVEVDRGGRRRGLGGRRLRSLARGRRRCVVVPTRDDQRQTQSDDPHVHPELLDPITRRRSRTQSRIPATARLPPNTEDTPRGGVHVHQHETSARPRLRTNVASHATTPACCAPCRGTSRALGPGSAFST